MRKNTTRRGKIPPYQRFSTSNFDKLHDNSNLLNDLTLTINNIPKTPLWCYRGQDATFSAGSTSCSWVGYGYGSTIDTYNSGGTGNEAAKSQITPFDTSTGLMLGSVDKGFSLSSGTSNHPDQNSEYQDFVYEIV